MVITMPQLGESVTSGTIVKWLKQPGDRVTRYESIAEVVTDKVNAEIPSPAAGVMGNHIAAEGEVVQINNPICEFQADNEEQLAAPALSPNEGEKPVFDGYGADAAPEVAQEVQRQPQAEPVQHFQPQATGDSSMHLSPAVRMIAQEHGVDISKISGTGIGGRVTKKDVLDFVQSGGAASAPVVSEAPLEYQAPPAQQEPQAPSEPAPAEEWPFAIPDQSEPMTQIPEPPPVLMPATPKDVPETAPWATAVPALDAQETRTQPMDAKSEVVKPEPSPAGEASPVAKARPATSGNDEVIKLSPQRRAIAEHMVRSVATSPHAWTMVEVDMSKVVHLRDKNKEGYAARNGAELTFLPFVARATIQALREFPTLNASWSDQGIVVKRDINLGIAVSLEDSLVVPVVHGADGLTLSALAKAFADLGKKARGGQLAISDVEGGTFTLNNSGALGTLLSAAIINQPQAAILVMDAIVKKPVVVEGDAIAVRPMMNLSISFDHRINDGLTASRFLQSVKKTLESVADHFMM